MGLAHLKKRIEQSFVPCLICSNGSARTSRSQTWPLDIAPDGIGLEAVRDGGEGLPPSGAGRRPRAATQGARGEV